MRKKVLEDEATDAGSPTDSVGSEVTTFAPGDRWVVHRMGFRERGSVWYRFESGL